MELRLQPQVTPTLSDATEYCMNVIGQLCLENQKFSFLTTGCANEFLILILQLRIAKTSNNYNNKTIRKPKSNRRINENPSCDFEVKAQVTHSYRRRSLFICFLSNIRCKRIIKNGRRATQELING